MELVRNGKLLLSHFENKDQDFILTHEGREIFARALRSRILEVHQYIELDKKRYSFLYTADRQIKSLIRAFRELDPSLYETSYTEEEREFAKQKNHVLSDYLWYPK